MMNNKLLNTVEKDDEISDDVNKQSDCILFNADNKDFQNFCNKCNEIFKYLVIGIGALLLFYFVFLCIRRSMTIKGVCSFIICAAIGILFFAIYKESGHEPMHAFFAQMVGIKGEVKKDCFCPDDMKLTYHQVIVYSIGAFTIPLIVYIVMIVILFQFDPILFLLLPLTLLYGQIINCLGDFKYIGKAYNNKEYFLTDDGRVLKRGNLRDLENKNNLKK